MGRSNKISKRLKRAVKRWLKKQSNWFLAAALLFLLIGSVRISTMPTIDQSSYAPLLQTIAKGESNGNYNAYYGAADNKAVQFTGMTIAEVLAWQDEYVATGQPSSAVGKYQIIRPTLAGLVSERHIDQQRLFDEALQDELAVALIERRGAEAYAEDELTKEQFAANLAKEWAALPRIVGPDPEDSYYAGDGINKSRIATDEVLNAIAAIRYE